MKTLKSKFLFIGGLAFLGFSLLVILGNSSLSRLNHGYHTVVEDDLLPLLQTEVPHLNEWNESQKTLLNADRDGYQVMAGLNTLRSARGTTEVSAAIDAARNDLTQVEERTAQASMAFDQRGRAAFREFSNSFTVWKHNVETTLDLSSAMAESIMEQDTLMASLPKGFATTREALDAFVGEIETDPSDHNENQPSTLRM